MTAIHRLKKTLIDYVLRPISERMAWSRYSRPALNQLDQKLLEYMDFRHGFFVELGANDGFTQSNTYYFEKFLAWTGILVEPIPRQFQKAVRRRPNSQVFNFACVPFDYPESTIQMTDLDLMSFANGAFDDASEKKIHVTHGTGGHPDRATTVNVPVRTLTSILDECNVTKIDLLSLDVEGFEASVLQGLDLERYRPTYMVIEARYRSDVEAVIRDYYELVAELSTWDVLYKVKKCD